MRRHLFWRLYFSYLAIVVLCAVAVGWYGLHAARSLYLTESENDLHARAQLVAGQLAPLAAAAGSGGAPVGDRAQALARTQALAAAQGLVGELDRASGTRITLIATDGTVLADSEADPSTLDNHAGRPEVHTALVGGVGRSIRYSDTLGEDMMYVAMPVTGSDGRVTAVVRTAVPLTAVDKALQEASRRLMVITALVALLAAAMGLFVSRAISGQMQRIQAGAERFAAGDFAHKLPIPVIEEFAGVAISLNTMAEQLDATIVHITQLRNEREAMLASMVEGVFAVDDEGRLITMNDAARRVMDCDLDDVIGRGIEEVSRSSDLQQFVAQVLGSSEPAESEIVFRSKGSRFDRHLQAHGARMHEGGGAGAVVVLHDVTQLRRLETVRRDFVANVSHELRTPVTSIKGFAETLLDGALDEPADAQRFVRIIADQADRLNAIIEDLLGLSRLELESQEGTPELSEGPVCDVLQLAVGAAADQARARGVELTLSCAADLQAAMDPPLLERAVVNLIENAVKYSATGDVVEIEGRPDGDGVVIVVRDHGAGIDRRHHARLFERFYRVDKARTREVGGTGLGLAIVKHVAQIHGGRVTVESTPGVGSTFRIFLPH